MLVLLNRDRLRSAWSLISQSDLTPEYLGYNHGRVFGGSGARPRRAESAVVGILGRIVQSQAATLLQPAHKKRDLNKGDCTVCYVQTVGEGLWSNLNRDRLSSAWSLILPNPRISRSFNWLAMKTKAWEYTDSLEFQRRVIKYIIEELRQEKRMPEEGVPNSMREDGEI
ncbi:hypothetical protein ACOMHN_012584 [Nucella lapillus]